MNKILTSAFSIALFLFIESCGSVKNPYCQLSDRNWKENEPDKNELPAFTLYLIGDAGEPELKQQEPTFKLLQEQLEKENENSAIIFMGDNIYRHGMPPHEEGEVKSEERILMEQKINESLKILKNFKGRPFFIPGNHDWNNSKTGGRLNVKAQQEYIENYLSSNKVYFPGNACAGPTDIKLTDDLTLILLDSEWWLHNRDKEPNINEDCEYLTEEEILLRVDEILQKAQKKNKTVIIAAHHPIYTNGSHGGYYSYKDHLFPLTALNEKLYVPLPILGSIQPVYRKLFGTVQDLPHPKYRLYRKSMLRVTKDFSDIIFVSGHEHSLQYFEKQNQHFIVSGSGTKTTYVRKGKGATFSYSANGFSKLLYYADGSVWTEFWTPKADGTEGELVFRKKIKAAAPPPTPVEILEKNAIFTVNDSVAITQASSLYKAKGFKRSLLGNQYRDVWAATVTAPILNLSETKGGLIPIKRGGGFQTKSLRLEAPDEKQYVLRSIEKDVSKVVPSFLKKTFIKNLIQDGISASNPYAAFVIPPLAEAAGVYHTNPKLVFLPYQKNLAEYNESFGGEMYIFEERPDGNWSDEPSLGASKELISTSDVLKNINKNPDHVIDEKQVLRSRLFDILINDWDRHDDQWRWATFEENDKIIYRPIPRDRDQTFFKFKGALPWLASRKWLARYSKLQTFDSEIYNIEGLTFNARYFDRTFLVGLNEEDWESVAKELQASITDEVIENAIRTWPETIFKLHGEDIIKKLKGRRNIISKYAKRYYKVLAKNVDVVGTKKDELFKVERIDNQSTKVSVYRLSKKDKVGALIYERIFKTKETKEINLYGRKGNDRFEISGEVRKGILIRVIGGGGEDEVVDKSKVKGIKKHTQVYDKKKGLQLEGGKETKDKSNNHDEVNEYDRMAFAYNVNAPAGSFGFNVDDGLFLGAGVSITRHGFRKKPYAARHVITANTAFTKDGFNLIYRGDLNNVFGKWGISNDAVLTGPIFVGTFFGLGNNTQLTEVADEDKDYNYLKLKQATILPLLKRNFGAHHTIKIGPMYQYTKVEKTEGRFVSTPESGLSDEDFKQKHYAGIKAIYAFEKVDNPVNPQYGLRFTTSGGWLANVENTSRNFASVESELSLYYTFELPLKPTLAVRVGGGSNFGEYEFYQAKVLGGSINLRGYRYYRFSGKANFFNNSELRFKLFDFSNIALSGSFGILGFFDSGRVWLPDETSDRWHYGYGGGIWVSPFKLFVISADYGISKEDKLVTLYFKFLF